MNVIRAAVLQHAVRGARRFSSDVIMWRSDQTNVDGVVESDAEAEAAAEAAVLDALEGLLDDEDVEKAAANGAVGEAGAGWTFPRKNC